MIKNCLRFAPNNTCHGSRKLTAPGQVFAFIASPLSTHFKRETMNYTKPAVSFTDQVATLKARGLIIKDDKLATFLPQQYQLLQVKGLTYPFQDNTNPNHPFTSKISFEEIIDSMFSIESFG